MVKCLQPAVRRELILGRKHSVIWREVVMVYWGAEYYHKNYHKFYYYYYYYYY
jgi:hypothetical protein